MKHLYFTRHGESLINLRNVVASKYGTKNDLGLTEEGKQQAFVAGKKLLLDGLRIDLIVSSPLLRARETAEIIASVLGYQTAEITVSDLLIELQFGELEGASWREFWDERGGYKELSTFKGAETIETMQLRAAKALLFLKSLPEYNVLVVSHGAFGRALRRVVEGKLWTDEFENGNSLPHAEILQLI